MPRAEREVTAWVPLRLSGLSLASCLRAGALVLAFTGCSLVTVVRQATPNPLLGANAFVVAPTIFAGGHVTVRFSGMSLDEYFAALNSTDTLQLEAGLHAFDAAFVGALGSPSRRVDMVSGPHPPGAFVIQARLLTYYPETYNGRSGVTPARATFRVQIGSVDGTPLDIIDAWSDNGANFGVIHAESEVFISLARSLAGRVAEYLAGRTR